MDVKLKSNIFTEVKGHRGHKKEVASFNKQMLDYLRF